MTEGFWVLDAKAKACVRDQDGAKKPLDECDGYLVLSPHDAAVLLVRAKRCP